MQYATTSHSFHLFPPLNWTLLSLKMGVPQHAVNAISTCPREGGGGLGGAGDIFWGMGVRPSPRHPNTGLHQKFANVYPGVNQILVSIHYIYVAPNYF